MSEIYWITRLGYINTACSVIGIFGIIAGLVLLLFYLLQKQEVIEGSYDYEKEKRLLDTLKECKNWSLSISVILLLIALFTPTTKEAVMIWGIGNTIDYIKNNDTAQQLPDKCINALDAWVESLNEEEK